MSDVEKKAWDDYRALLEPYRNDSDAYERMEPWAWKVLQEELEKLKVPA